MRDEIRIYVHMYEYQNEAREGELKQYDAWAARDIKHLEETIEKLKEYRKELYQHTQQLQGMESRLQLKIKRERRYSGKIYYYVTVKRIYPANEKMYNDLISEHYEGADRHTAIKRYEQLKKQYPGIEAIKDIEKGRWEK